MPFDPQSALRYACDLARPRRVGTPEEQAIIEELIQRLRGFGWDARRQPFTFSTAHYTATIAIIGASLALVLLIFGAWVGPAWLPVLPAGALLVLLALAGRLNAAVTAAAVQLRGEPAATRWRRLCLRLGRGHATANVLATLAGAPAPAAGRPHLFLVAHSDSKSQALPLVVRMALMGLATAAAAGFAVLSLARPLWPALTPAAALTGLAALLAGTPVLLLFLAGAGNASPGANDNASGAGLVLHLAEVLAQRPPSVPVTLLITAAEELGVIGATALVQSAAAPGPPGVHVLNFDSVGVAGGLRVVGARRAGWLSDAVRTAGAQLGRPLGQLPAAGALFDHVPFAARGYDALSLVMAGPASGAIHTPADSVDKLDADGFRQAGEVALGVLAALERASIELERAPGGGVEQRARDRA